MDLATIFRLEENLNLDKRTLVFLRWIAIFGQLFSVNLVYFFFISKFVTNSDSLLIGGNLPVIFER